MKIVTTSPFYSNLRLRAGLDPKSAAFADTMAALPSESDEIFIPNCHKKGELPKKYEFSSQDSYDLRLFVYSPTVAKGAPQVRFHIHGNGVSVFTAEFEVKPVFSAEELEQHCKAVTREAFKKHCVALEAQLSTIRQKLPANLLDKQTPYEAMTPDNLCWITSAVHLTKSDLKSAKTQKFVKDWLAHTTRPEDAKAILAGTKSFSVTWLNYLIVEPSEDEARIVFSALRIAQFFYASQERLNDEAYRALTDSTLEKNVRLVESRLTKARRDMQMLHIMYDTQLAFVMRQKKPLIHNLMTEWDFDVLKANGERMVLASDTKINEITNRRSERSSFFTDLILVALALVTVIEVSMYMTEYSREVMSRPTLAYQDDETSWILAMIAAIDTDQMLVGGAFVILILVCFYVYWKI